MQSLGVMPRIGSSRQRLRARASGGDSGDSSWEGSGRCWRLGWGGSRYTVNGWRARARGLTSAQSIATPTHRTPCTLTVHQSRRGRRRSLAAPERRTESAICAPGGRPGRCNRTRATLVARQRACCRVVAPDAMPIWWSERWRPACGPNGAAPPGAETAHRRRAVRAAVPRAGGKRPDPREARRRRSHPSAVFAVASPAPAAYPLPRR